MNELLFMILFFTFTISYFFIGWFASKKIINTDDYFLAGRTLSIPRIIATLLAAQIGGGFFLGTAANPFDGLLYSIGMCCGLLVLGCSGIASKLRSFGVTTVGDIFKLKYQSTFLKNFTSILLTTSICGILICQIIAARSLFAGIAPHYEIALFILLWIVLVAYTMIGGFKSVTSTDIIQIIIIILIFTAICLYNIVNNPHSINKTIQFFINKQNSLSYNWGTIARIIAMPALFSLIEQDLAQKFFAAQSQKAAMIASLCACFILCIFTFIPVYCGIQAIGLSNTTSTLTNPLYFFLHATTNEFFFALALCALITAISQTSSSLLCAASSMCSSLLFQYCNKSNKDHIKIARYTTIFIGATTGILSFYISQNIINMLVISYEISIAGLLIPLLFAYFQKKLYKLAALLSSGFGIFSYLIFNIHPTIITYNLIIPTTLLLSLIGYIIGHWYAHNFHTKQSKLS